MIILAALMSLMISGTALASNHAHRGISTEIQHSGGTNSYGCHNDHIHGGYHCH